MKWPMIVLFAASPLVWGQSTADSIYKVIVAWLDGASPILTPEAKVLMRSGDAVATVVREWYDIKGLTPEQVDKLLYILKTAFELPESITRLEDRNPTVTMRLIDQLRKQSKSSEERIHIDTVASAIKTRVDESRGSSREPITTVCRVFFELSSGEQVLKFVHIRTSDDDSVTYQSDAYGKARLTLRTGRTQTYHFTAPDFEDASVTLSCVASETISREIILKRK
jgi:hypothetical protein